MSVNRQMIRRFLWVWHRRLGLVAALFLVWLSVSGVLLNHTSAVGLSKSILPATIAPAVFPIQQYPHYQSQHRLGEFTQFRHTLYLDKRSVSHCEGGFYGVSRFDQEYWAACGQQLIVLDAHGLYVESVDSIFGLPTPVEKIGVCGSGLCIQTLGKKYRLGRNRTDWSVHTGEVLWENDVSNELRYDLDPSIHNWERLILEAHSGRIFGNAGVMVFDLIALFCILLAFSGCYVWWGDHRRRRK